MKTKLCWKTLNIALYLLIYTLRFHPVKRRQITVKQNLLAPNDLNHLSNSRLHKRVRCEIIRFFSVFAHISSFKQKKDRTHIILKYEN